MRVIIGYEFDYEYCTVHVIHTDTYVNMYYAWYTYADKLPSYSLTYLITYIPM